LPSTDFRNPDYADSHVRALHAAGPAIAVFGRIINIRLIDFGGKPMARFVSLWWSGVAAGLSISFSLLAEMPGLNT
jgi:hypothetical protein